MGDVERLASIFSEYGVHYRIGARTIKMHLGHRGGNHPVMDLTTGRVEITCHNHGFSVDADSLRGADVEPTHVNLKRKTESIGAFTYDEILGRLRRELDALIEARSGAVPSA